MVRRNHIMDAHYVDNKAISLMSAVIASQTFGVVEPCRIQEIFHEKAKKLVCATTRLSCYESSSGPQKEISSDSFDCKHASNCWDKNKKDGEYNGKENMR